MKQIVSERKQQERSTRLDAMTAAHVQKEAMAAYPINITSTAVSSDFLSQMEILPSIMQ